MKKTKFKERELRLSVSFVFSRPSSTGWRGGSLHVGRNVRRKTRSLSPQPQRGTQVQVGETGEKPREGRLESPWKHDKSTVVE